MNFASVPSVLTSFGTTSLSVQRPSAAAPAGPAEMPPPEIHNDLKFLDSRCRGGMLRFFSTNTVSALDEWRYMLMRTGQALKMSNS